MRLAIFLLAAAIQSLTPASAQSPDIAQKDAPINALTADEQSALLDGQGMGFAKAAELNGYPGPKHVLELAHELALTDEQRRNTRSLFERMRTAARAGGAELVEAERSLASLFASRTATVPSVDAQLARIESLRARLRVIHLNAHLEQATLLSRHQLIQYAALRGYSTSSSHRH